MPSKALEGFRWQLEDETDEGRLFSSPVERHFGTGAFRGLEFLHVNAQTIINRVPAASRMPFRYTINAYRGCSHACTYCFARPTHEHLGLNSAEDFERRVVVKVNAVRAGPRRAVLGAVGPQISWRWARTPTLTR